jgi:hypothetical protein
MDNVSAQQTIVTRKLVSTATVTSSAGGYITVQTVNSGGVTGAYGWSNFSARWQQYRVKAMRVRLFPLVDATTAVSVGGGAVTPHPTAIAFATYKGGVNYASYSEVVAGSNARVFNGREAVIEYGVDWRGNPEARFWSDTNAAIPTTQLFGIQYQDTGIAPASAATTAYFRQVTEWEVELNNPS